jgi:hypothetical protein
VGIIVAQPRKNFFSYITHKTTYKNLAEDTSTPNAKQSRPVTCQKALHVILSITEILFNIRFCGLLARPICPNHKNASQVILSKNMLQSPEETRPT